MPSGKSTSSLRIQFTWIHSFISITVFHWISHSNLNFNHIFTNSIVFSSLSFYCKRYYKICLIFVLLFEKKNPSCPAHVCGHKNVKGAELIWNQISSTACVVCINTVCSMKYKLVKYNISTHLPFQDRKRSLSKNSNISTTFHFLVQDLKKTQTYILTRALRWISELKFLIKFKLGRKMKNC